MTEIYKDCEFDNSYKISNFGNIKRQYHNGKVKDLKCSMLNRGYKYIQIRREGKRRNYLIHRLVAIAFITNDNEDYSVIDHIDRNKLNNNVSNLRWCNQAINMKNIVGYRDDIIGNKKERHRIYDKEYNQINKEKIKIKKQEKYNNNKEKLLEKFDCDCGGKYIFNHKKRHIKSKKHQKYLTTIEDISPTMN